MISLLDVPEIRERVLRLSVADYHRCTDGRRTELLRGIILEKPSQSPLHSFIAHRLSTILARQIAPDLILFHGRPIAATDSEPEPDLMIIRGPEEVYRSGHPSTAELVIEVAVSSLEIDRVKALIYAECAVGEYWIVCPEKKQVEVYRRPGPDGYGERLVVTAPSRLACATLTGVSVDLGELF